MTPTPSEAVALAWVRRYLRGHHCDRCGQEWVTAASVGVLVHRCAPPRRRGLPPTWSRESYQSEARRAWAERQLGPLAEAIEDKVGPDAWYVPDEE